MTFLLGGEVAELDAVRQKGEAELRIHCQYLHLVRDQRTRTYEERSVHGQEGDTLATPDTATFLVVWMDTNRPGPFPGQPVSKCTTRVTGQTNLLLLFRGHD